MKKKKTISLEEEIVLAEKIKLLFEFIYSLKKYRKLLKKIAKEAEKRAELAVSAAVLNPFGYEVAEKKHKRVAKRAKLLVQMIDIIEETDKEVLEAIKEQKKMKKEVSKIFGF